MCQTSLIHPSFTIPFHKHNHLAMQTVIATLETITYLFSSVHRVPRPKSDFPQNSIDLRILGWENIRMLTATKANTATRPCRFNSI